jgi:hypothetical protein
MKKINYPLNLTIKKIEKQNNDSIKEVKGNITSIKIKKYDSQFVITDFFYKPISTIL